MNARFLRARAFADGVIERAVEEVRPFPWGAALTTPSLARVFDANLLRVDGPGLAPDDAEDLATRLLPAATLTIRCADEALAAALEARGWERSGHVYMELPAHAPHPVPDARAEQVAMPATEGVRRSALAAEDWAERRVVEELVEWDRRVAQGTGDIWFAGFEGRSPAAVCRLLSDAAVGQVEDVLTVPEARRRGLARAVVAAAVAASRAARHELTFLVADAEDWPREFYARMGFEPIGSVAVMRRRARED